VTDRIREQCLEEARQTTWALLAVGELAGSYGIDPETIRRAAPGLLSPATVRLASTLASACLGQIEVISLLLAGGYDEAAIAAFEADLRPAPRPRARARARRPRPVTVAPPVEPST
jgi:hypothetical protein